MKRVIFAVTALALCQTEVQAAGSLLTNAPPYQRVTAGDAPVVEVRYKTRGHTPRRGSDNPWKNPWWYQPGLTAGGGVPRYPQTYQTYRPVEWGTTGQNGMGLRWGPGGSYRGSTYGPCTPNCF